jgi:hypothetical protein
LIALFHAEMEAALRFNPLFFLACLGLPVWWTTATLAQAFRWRWPERVRQRVTDWPVWQIVLTLVALNWLYLCLNLPK